MLISCICSKPCFITITMCMSRRSFVAEVTICWVFMPDAIREQVQAMQYLRLQDDEYQWLSALPFFKADYLNWLREFRFNPEQVTVSNDNGKLDIRLSGPWREVILWEVPLLAVISEMVHRYRSPQARRCASPRHAGKQISRLLALTAGLDMSRFHLMDFGTRRRFSREVQETIVKRLQQESWFVGTSNYDLARRLSLTPNGNTSTRMVPGASANQSGSCQQPASCTCCLAGRISRPTWHALTDCIYHGCFLRDFGVEFASRYQGLRHDSGDPVEWGEKPLHIIRSWELIHRVKRWFSLTIWIYAKRLSYTATSLPACN
ncbi:nicotinate phosphoribosyltransferase [Escherichia coli]|uniref:nicotinate phosphoribosyltransferase n=1 Tax=Escherichia coli TaxID=562 RepID=A0A377CZL1_ECOLX|nr:nicotinate phosphoribosyltransferase [Escherichia coli]